MSTILTLTPSAVAIAVATSTSNPWGLLALVREPKGGNVRQLATFSVPRLMTVWSVEDWALVAELPEPEPQAVRSAAVVTPVQISTRGRVR